MRGLVALCLSMRAVGPRTCALYRDIDARKLLVRDPKVSFGSQGQLPTLLTL